MKPLLKKLLRIPLLLLGLASGLTLLAAVAYWLSDRTNGSLVSSGVKRKYLLYVPKSYDPARPAPLVISIHGFCRMAGPPDAAILLERPGGAVRLHRGLSFRPGPAEALAHRRDPQPSQSTRSRRLPLSPT